MHLPSKQLLERFAVGVPLPSVVASITAILRFVCRQLAVAIRTDEPQIHAAVVGRVPVHVIEDQHEGHAIPVVPHSTDGAAPALLGSEVVPDVVTSVRHSPATYASLEPGSQKQLPPMRLLARIRAEDPGQTAFDIDSASDTFDQHEVTLPLSTDKFGARPVSECHSYRTYLGSEGSSFAVRMRPSVSW
ncbi:hypothetical protein MHPYR_130153 [uncultured Mycobacterium sp.]|uniref:Uncharacterized protein n=1 Tax=uncultured Mycobacterium sp. TaxID=171292 RepID=A0A1Y5P164_9MYCO|nr:hypothetical protein MHPYR_130153 [uncultured Mycobacterium sp.]